jgi:hypothetical protein
LNASRWSRSGRGCRDSRSSGEITRRLEGRGSAAAALVVRLGIAAGVADGMTKGDGAWVGRLITGPPATGKGLSEGSCDGTFRSSGNTCGLAATRSSPRTTRRLEGRGAITLFATTGGAGIGGARGAVPGSAAPVLAAGSRSRWGSRANRAPSPIRGRCFGVAATGSFEVCSRAWMASACGPGPGCLNSDWGFAAICGVGSSGLGLPIGGRGCAASG